MSVDVKALRALLDKATRGPLSVGWTLSTATTRLWTPMERASNDREERRRVFARFTPFDQGRSRQLVAVANDPDDAALHVAAVNALPDLLALAEAVRELAGPIAMLVEHGSIEEREAARRVTAILDTTNAGDGR